MIGQYILSVFSVYLEHYAEIIESKKINLGDNFSLFCDNTVTLKNKG